MMTDRIARYTLLLLIVVGSTGYAGIALYPTLVGPTVSVVTPTQYAVSESGALTLTGTAKRFTSLSMNGRRVVTRAEGSFEERMLLTPGTNTFILTATDNFGTETEERVTVVYVPNKKDEVETARIVPLEEVLSF